MICKKITIAALILAGLATTSDIYSQNLKADGYKGLWYKSVYSSEYGYKYSGGLGTFSAQHKPAAIYSPDAAKTFFIYSGTASPDKSHLQIMISYFDHRTHRVPKPVIVHDKMGVNDPHDNASISIDSEGYLYVFISGRGRTRPGLIFRSRVPWSIESFEKIFEGEILFPQPWWMKDSCFMMMHTKNLRGRELFWSTGVDGKSWSRGLKLAGFGGHFQVSNAYDNKIFSVFTYFPERNVDRRTNLYLVQSGDMGKTWRTIDNKLLKTPLTDVRNDALVKDFEAENKLVFINDLNFDKEGNPVILAVISSDNQKVSYNKPKDYMVIYWRDSKWNFVTICEADHNYDMGPLYISGEEWRVIAPTEPGPHKNVTGGEMVLWISKDEGVNWTRVKQITQDSRFDNSYARRPVSAHKEFYSYWADGDAEKMSESRLYFTDHDCKKVWVLPYDMSKNSARPKRIR